MEGYLYILESENCQRYYIGSTLDIDRRFHEHNSGFVTATRGKGPWNVAFRQKLDKVIDARRAENWLKKLKSRRVIEQIIKDGKISRVF